MLLPLLYFEATEAVLLYLVSGVALKVETSRWLSSGKLVAPKEDNIHGIYEFEVWGASGAAAKVDSLVAEGGLGGHSKGYKKMNIAAQNGCNLLLSLYLLRSTLIYIVILSIMSMEVK